MRKVLLILSAVTLMGFQSPYAGAPRDADAPTPEPVLQQQAPDAGPPPEPPENVAPCHNHHDDSAKNCQCPMGSPGDGSHDTRPDPALGQKWCMTYCRTGKCGCLKPMKTVMPWGRE